ncbi:MAG: phage tail assembly chaperone [Hyphomicrobiaceae bacterium]
MIAVALGVLRLDPAAFWSMTVTELRAALSVLGAAHAQERPPARSDVVQMMQRFPDRSET